MSLKGLRDSARTRRGKLAIWLVVLVGFALTFATVAIPVWIVVPFKPQTSEGLSRAYFFRSWSPIVTVAFLIALVGAIVLIWPASKWWLGRPALVILLLGSGMLAWFSRQNYFEWMFHPIPAPSYAKAGDAGFLKPGDMVLGIEINHDAAAYPLRFIGYHHVVNDVVGGTPISVTY